MTLSELVASASSKSIVPLSPSFKSVPPTVVMSLMRLIKAGKSLVRFVLESVPMMLLLQLIIAALSPFDAVRALTNEMAASTAL
jgi:hypothetical protein